VQAEILAKFRPKLKPSSLIPNLQFAERTIAESLHNFRSVRHMVLYYEDIINNQKVEKYHFFCLFLHIKDKFAKFC
jgi:hypothetical protein